MDAINAMLFLKWMTGLHCSFGENILAVLALAFNYLS